MKPAAQENEILANLSPMDEQTLNQIRNILSLIRAIDDNKLSADSVEGQSFVNAIENTVLTLSNRLEISSPDTLHLCWRLFLAVYFALGKEPADSTVETLVSLQSKMSNGQDG